MREERGREGGREGGRGGGREREGGSEGEGGRNYGELNSYIYMYSTLPILLSEVYHILVMVSKR